MTRTTIGTLMRACTYFFDVLLPPRKTERLVRTLSAETLYALRTPGGMLPYHEPHITALVWELKYRKNGEALQLAGTFLAETAMAVAEESLAKPVLVPVPMHDTRRKARGYNQTEALCEAMLRAAPNMFEYAPHALRRVRNTIPQQGLPKHRRLKNILGAIEMSDPKQVAGKSCIIIDDVATTGATTHEAKRALLAGGAREVHIITLAHS